LIVEHHYLHAAKLVGEHLRYAATDRGEWLAVVSFSAAAYHLRYRDQFIGWSPEQRRLRPPLVVNHARFLILPGAHYSNLASRLLARGLARLSDDWQARWGHPDALVETFVDPEFFRATTYKVSGWSELGPTSGFGRHAQDCYEPHERPKQLWVKQLVKGACQQVRAPQLPAAGALVETHAPVRRTTPVCAIGSLLEECRSLPGVSPPPSAGVAGGGHGRVNRARHLLSVATFCDVMRGQRDLAAFARKLSQPQLRTLGFDCDIASSATRPPGAGAARARRRFSEGWARCRPTKSMPCSCAGRPNSSVRCRTRSSRSTAKSCATRAVRNSSTRSADRAVAGSARSAWPTKATRSPPRKRSSTGSISKAKSSCSMRCIRKI
jgi:Domain of unknown function (DUF4338)